MSDSISVKQKFPAEVAKAVARELCELLKPCCELNAAEGRPYLVVAGSLRRRKDAVGDLEIVYVPQWGEISKGLFPEQGCLVDHALDGLIAAGVLQKRLNTKGSEMWGPKNKLARHVATGLPVDFFAIAKPHWFNYLVCRTGGADNNKQIAVKAQERGLAWHPYHSGFSVACAATFISLVEGPGVHLTSGLMRSELIRTGKMIEVKSEQDVFALAGMEYREPWERE